MTDPAEEVRAHMERAEQALAAVGKRCNAGLYDDAASRAYYAAFHAASAALMDRGMAFRKHGALIGAVNRHLVQGGAVVPETGKWLAWLFELRAVGDYGEIIHVEAEQARLALSRAETFVQTFRSLLRS